MWLDDGLHLSFADALFEGVSGITTTGATVIGDVSALPKSYLYYRAQLNFIGGLGVIVLAVAVLPLLGIGGMLRITRAEQAINAAENTDQNAIDNGKNKTNNV